MNMESMPNQNNRKEISQRLWIANEANLKAGVKDIKVSGNENIKEIPPGAKIVVMTTHLTDLDVPLAIHAVGRELDVIVTNQSNHHSFFGKQGEKLMNIGMRIAGKENFLPIGYHRNESGEKTAKAFDPADFEPAAQAMEKGKSVIIAAHNPSETQLQNLDNVKGGYGGVYLALLTDAYILPTTVVLDRAAGMQADIAKTIINKPNASVVIGKPFKLEKIPGIERFSELTKKRDRGEKLTEEERQEFSKLADVLREKSQEVIKKMSEQITTQG